MTQKTGHLELTDIHSSSQLFHTPWDMSAIYREGHRVPRFKKKKNHSRSRGGERSGLLTVEENEWGGTVEDKRLCETQIQPEFYPQLPSKVEYESQPLPQGFYNTPPQHSLTTGSSSLMTKHCPRWFRSTFPITYNHYWFCVIGSVS